MTQWRACHAAGGVERRRGGRVGVVCAHVRDRRVAAVHVRHKPRVGLREHAADWVTEDTSHSPIGWMNAAAPLNIMYMFVTEDTFQPPIGWLNAAAPLNM